MALANELIKIMSDIYIEFPKNGYVCGASAAQKKRPINYTLQPITTQKNCHQNISLLLQQLPTGRALRVVSHRIKDKMPRVSPKCVNFSVPTDTVGMPVTVLRSMSIVCFLRNTIKYSTCPFWGLIRRTRFSNSRGVRRDSAYKTGTPFK